MTKNNAQSLTIEGTKSLDISIAVLFATLLDKQMLQSLIPGCRYIEKTHYQKTKAELLLQFGDKQCIYIFEIVATSIKPSSVIICSLNGNGGHAGNLIPV